MSFPVGPLGPCEVVYNGTSLGAYESVSVRIVDEGAEITDARKGNIPTDRILTGRKVTVEASLKNVSLANLAAVNPAMTLTGSELMIQNPVGRSQYDNAAVLILKRIVEGVVSSDQTQWITFFKATPMADMDWTFDVETQRIFKAMFDVFPVAATASGETYAVDDFGAIGYGQTS